MHHITAFLQARLGRRAGKKPGACLEQGQCLRLTLLNPSVFINSVKSAVLDSLLLGNPSRLRLRHEVERTAGPLTLLPGFVMCVAKLNDTWLHSLDMMVKLQQMMVGSTCNYEYKIFKRFKVASPNDNSLI